LLKILFLYFIDFCNKCKNDFGNSYMKIQQNLNKLESKYNYTKKICRKCSNITIDLDIENCCKSMDCPLLFLKHHLKSRLKIMYQIAKNFVDSEY